jgi:subtilisin family serine protease
MGKMNLNRRLTSVVVLFFIFTLILGQGISVQAALDGSQLKVTSEGGYAELINKVGKKGAVRLIVTLNVPFNAMGHMAAREADLQASQISQGQADVHASLAGHNVTRVTNFKYVPQIALTVDRPALDALVAHPSVVTIHEDIPRPHMLAQSVPLIGAPTVWGFGYTGAGVAVAILDTGVDKTHPFLSGAVVSEACYSSNYAPSNATSICPGGVTNSTAVGSALPYAGTCPAGACDHGTHVSGIAAGRTDGSVTFSGVAKGASIIAIQVFSRFETSAECGNTYPCAMAFDSDIILGLERVYDLRGTYNISSVNLSLGSGDYTSYCDSEPEKPSIDNLKSVNIATIIASGNDGDKGGISAPACISSAVSVGATDDITDMVTAFSNSASFLSLLAPGEWITSSIPGGGYGTWAGTSMAAPHVAGAWALLRQARPSANVDQVLTALGTTGLGIMDTNSITKPRIRVDQAMLALSGCTYSINPVVSDILPSSGGIGTITVATQSGCAWSVSIDSAPTWMTITSGSSGTGSGTVNYSISSNSSSILRTGTVNVANKTFTVQQNGTGCSYLFSPTIGTSIGAVGGTESFSVTTQNGCNWTASKNSVWLTITSGSGTGNGIVTYQLNNNTSPSARSGRITINGLIYVVKQNGTGLSKLGVSTGGSWYLDMNGNGAWEGSSIDRVYPNFGQGLTGAIPVVGDWDGSGVTRIGVYWNGSWYLDIDGNGSWDGAVVDHVYSDFGSGLPNAWPVVGAW